MFITFQHYHVIQRLVGHNSVESKTKSIRPRPRSRPKPQDQDQDRGRSETGLVIRPRSQTPRLSYPLSLGFVASSTMSLSPIRVYLSVCVYVCPCRFSYLAPKYFVQDAQSQTVFLIEGPACIIQGLCFTQDQEFVVSLSLSLPLCLSVCPSLCLRCIVALRVGICG